MPKEKTRDSQAFRMSRRKMMKGVAAVLGALALPEKDAPAVVWEEFFQKNFRELSAEEKAKVIARLEKEYGERIGFDESYRLCGQCHGDKYRDWKVGVHGKRTGMWNGEKQYLLCVHCHNPHDPGFKPLQPMPPPVRPENIRK